ncbi:hypothetical protein GY45DRAFT_1249834, partial [Cubamyces sp. BRFM 1775]
MADALIRVILGLDHARQGIFGTSAAYYGTVEEQGRKTLHLHLLLWIEGSPSPQNMRDRLLSDPTFESELLTWLSSVHVGDFFTHEEDKLQTMWEQPGVDSVVNGRVKRGKPVLLIPDAASVLPPRPPPPGVEQEVLKQWHEDFLLDVDKVVFCSNRHDRDHRFGCLRGHPEYCRARFPRERQENTVVDRNSGAVRFKKRDVWINTFNPLLSHLLRCNTDVTCLLSGTQVKA